jgi:hypothetical protein
MNIQENYSFLRGTSNRIRAKKSTMYVFSNLINYRFNINNIIFNNKPKIMKFNAILNHSTLIDN